MKEIENALLLIKIWVIIQFIAAVVVFIMLFEQNLIAAFVISVFCIFTVLVLLYFARAVRDYLAIHVEYKRDNNYNEKDDE